MKKTIEERINTYGSYLKKRYGRRMFKAGLSLNTECPHRQKTGGCIFCLPETYTDDSLDRQPEPLKQLEELIPKIRKGCGDVGLLAYYHHNTSTAGETEELKQIFSDTLKHSETDGLIISTRPDFLKKETVEMLSNLKGEVFLEIGMQSIHQRSLDYLNRGHTLQDISDAVELCHEYGIETGVHLILGIPGESMSDMLETIRYVNENKAISQIKFHNLIVYRKTKLAETPSEVVESIPDYDEYISMLSTVLQHTRGDKVIGRLFTSNVRQSNIALNSFPGLKREWQNRLISFMNEHDIIQGSETDLPYNQAG